MIKNEKKKKLILFGFEFLLLVQSSLTEQRQKLNQNKLTFFLCWEYFAEKFIMLLTCFVNETILVIAFVVIKIMIVD